MKLCGPLKMTFDSKNMIMHGKSKAWPHMFSYCVLNQRILSVQYSQHEDIYTAVLTIPVSGNKLYKPPTRNLWRCICDDAATCHHGQRTLFLFKKRFIPDTISCSPSVLWRNLSRTIFYNLGSTKTMSNFFHQLHSELHTPVVKAPGAPFTFVQRFK